MQYPYQLTLQRYKLIFALPSNRKNLDYMGAKIRGMIGNALHQYQQETFLLLFENKINSNNPAYNWVKENVPSPFMITPLPFRQNQTTCEIMLTLFGEFSNSLPNIIKAMHDAYNKRTDEDDIFELMSYEKQSCLLTQQTTFAFDAIQQKINEQLTDKHTEKSATQFLKLHFSTPFLIVEKNKLITDFALYNFAKALHRRLAILSAVFGKAQQKIEELEESNLFDNIHLAKIELNRINTKRQPSAKNEYYKHGWRGNISYAGNFEMLLPLLYFGQYIQVGQDTAFGFGAYHLDFFLND